MLPVLDEEGRAYGKNIFSCFVEVCIVANKLMQKPKTIKVTEGNFCTLMNQCQGSFKRQWWVSDKMSRSMHFLKKEMSVIFTTLKLMVFITQRWHGWKWSSICNHLCLVVILVGPHFFLEEALIVQLSRGCAASNVRHCEAMSCRAVLRTICQVWWLDPSTMYTIGNTSVIACRINRDGQLHKAF